MEREATQVEQEVTKMITWIFESYTRVPAVKRAGYDRDVRHPEWTRWLLDAVGHPDEFMYNVAVTGSKGKGTHAILLAAVLERLGLRVGLFTSPHLVDFLERIRINGLTVPNEDFVRLARCVKLAARDAELPSDEYFGPVGLVAVMASLWFREQKTDVNVFELGRGALHDDVNQVVHQGALLTPIFPEHLDKLGPTWSDVVREKLGVVTAHTKWAVSYTQAPEVEGQIAAYFDDSKVTSRLLGRDFSYELVNGTGGVQTVFAYAGGVTHRAVVGAELALYAGNVAVSLVAAHHVLQSLKRIDDAIEVNLLGLRLPGRMQVISKDPTCLVDGAIHAVNARFVVKWLKAVRPTGKITAILSLPDDKDALGVISTLAPYVHAFVFTTSSNPHLRYTQDYTAVATEQGVQSSVEPDVEIAVQRARDAAHKEDTLLFLGTQSYVGDVLRFFDVPTQSLWESGCGQGRGLH
ncbi:bifunctional folylpolyglutamate synthase/dihydrofolate synthase [Alicyclobacillus acidoterrestris]|uniref:bifunctional folylpolyglutamate synthase/dihydrofolate synthase n=1 Tax=Alicyclobacillus suci TaxID=2816080 RepID=UPI0011940B8A|nr:bifunctional folylpolyglutamate synthase/dihydrofolate synthase [Alicyclobacillus suci]GEO24376.1 bifunctional folylpolyglutamate synthase/dihydrofolate synthase [Alicyclobacillus acidoterrestris]